MLWFAYEGAAMKQSFEFLANELRRKNIRLSHHRIKVLEYLLEHQNHPTVEQIYNDLHKEVLTLSKTTIYNTLNALIEANLVRVLAIEDNETRYDIITENHGHFKCESCGAIYNFPVDIESIAVEGLTDFQIEVKDVYFKGICNRCLKDKNKAKEES